MSFYERDMNWEANINGVSLPLLYKSYDFWLKLKPSQNGYKYDTKSNQMLTFKGA